MREFKQNLTAICADVDLSELSPDLAEQMCTALKEALASAGAEGLRTFVQSYEEQADVARANGELFRFKALRHLAQQRLAHWKRSYRGRLQDIGQDTSLPQRHAMEAQRWTAHSRTAHLPKVKQMG